MTDFFYWGGPVYCSTIEQVKWRRETDVFCNPQEGSSNRAFFDSLGSDPLQNLLAKAGVPKPASVGLAGFSAFHGFASPLLEVAGDRVDYVHLADACFQGAGATEPKAGLAKFAARAVAGKARMTVTTNGPWDKDISYWGPAGSKYEGTKFSLTSGAKCFHNVWRAVTGDAGASDAQLPADVPAPDRVFRKGQLYWFHYEGRGQADPHGWHANTLAAPFIQLYGVPWMAGERPVGAAAGSAAKVVAAMAAVAAAGLGGYLLMRHKGYVRNVRPEALGLPFYERSFPKKCKCCGRVYDSFQWHRLPLLGVQRMPWGEELEMRNCWCGTTLGIMAVEGE